MFSASMSGSGRVNEINNESTTGTSNSPEEKQNGSTNTAVTTSSSSEEKMTTTTTVLRVAVGTSNRAKIYAIENALRRAITNAKIPIELDIQGHNVKSGVQDQPFGDNETLTGAKNRAVGAYNAYKVANERVPHIAIGIEGGLEWNDNNNNNNCDDNDTKLYCMAWIAIYGKRIATTVEAFSYSNINTYVGDKKPIYGLAKTALFQLPDKITALIKQGIELGHADDEIFNRTNSKEKSGTVGILTDGLITRSDYYEHAILLALIPWIQPNLFPNGN